MSRGIVRQLKLVAKEIDRQIANATDQSDKFSRGLAQEGYAGGYADAIQDVMLALNGVTPDRRYWRVIKDKVTP